LSQFSYSAQIPLANFSTKHLPSVGKTEQTLLPQGFPLINENFYQFQNHHQGDLKTAFISAYDIKKPSLNGRFLH
jgi:hypothetical protein